MKTTLLFLFMAALSAHAEELQVVDVTSDAVEGHFLLKLELDSDHSIVQVHSTSPKGAKIYQLEDFLKGFTMLTLQGKDVVKIKSPDLDRGHGGKITMTYLTNGVTNSYEDYPIDLVRQGDEWRLFTNDKAGRHPFTEMYMKAKTVLGKTIGIDKITVK